MVNLVQAAADFAKQAHESIGQRRKYTNESYIVHPEAVAALVSRVTDDAATIAAAWLHDVVEDTPVSLQDIEVMFGQEVGSLVSDLTDVAKPSDGNRRMRKAIDREHTSKADPRAKTVKLADIIDNIESTIAYDDKFGPIFLGECEKLIEVLHDGDAALYAHAEKIIAEARKKFPSKR